MAMLRMKIRPSRDVLSTHIEIDEAIRNERASRAISAANLSSKTMQTRAQFRSCAKRRAQDAADDRAAQQIVIAQSIAAHLAIPRRSTRSP